MTIKVVFAVTETGPEAAAGDYFTALELGTALEARYGWQVDYFPKGDSWYDLAGVDVLITMVDEYELPLIRHAAPSLITIAWARNWFERWCDRPWIGDYSLLLASSRQAISYMSQRTGKLTRLLRIATNPARFNANQRMPTPEMHYVFTGSYWQSARDITTALIAIPPHFRGAVYGRHWEDVPKLAHLHRGFISYDRIHEVYKQTMIVIDDANHVTKTWGAANSRVFDALASGCLVITNAESVSEEVFDGLLPVYHHPEELVQLLGKYVGDSEARNSLLDELRSMVLKKHSYVHRAFELGLHLQLWKKEIVPVRQILRR